MEEMEDVEIKDRRGNKKSILRNVKSEKPSLPPSSSTPQPRKRKIQKSLSPAISKHRRQKSPKASGKVFF